MVSATTPDSVTAVKQFYEQTFGSEMEVSLEMDATIMATINYNGAPHQLMIVDEAGTTRVVVTSE
jgi:predicted enzyme related to lactoylglutathione lyase